MTAKQRLIDWANGQEGWVRALVGEALTRRSALPADVIAGAFEAMLAEKQLGKGEPSDAPPLAATDAADEAGEALRLERLRGVSSVNALAGGQELAFHPRLTVVYGENAAGKSGYVRVLKRLAAVRSAQAVLPDFRTEAPARPHATLDYVLGGKAQTLEWNDEAGVEPLTRMSVFDSHAVSLHVDEDLTYVFTPAGLALYRHVHQAIDAVKAKLDARVAEARAAPNPFLPHFQRDGLVFPKLESLGAASPLDDFTALASLTPVEAERLEALKGRAHSLKPEGSKVLLQAAVSDVELYEQLASVAKALRTYDWKGHAAARDETDAFAEDEIPGSTEPAWREFIAAAEAYLHEVGEKAYPHRGDDCLYCRQPLKPPAVALIKRYRKNAEPTRPSGLAAIPVVPLLQSVLRRVQALDEVPPVLSRTVPLLELATKLQQGSETDASQLVRIATEVEQSAAKAKQSAEGIIASLKKQGGDRQTELLATAAELATLENRRALKPHLDALAAFIERATWSAAAAQASGRISSVLRAVTEQSKLANEEALNQDFERLFRAECEALRAPKVEVDFAGRKGQAARKKMLSREHRLSELLSEGEQKVIALADFLAEVALRRSAAPVVFDDPVNSLDHKRIEHIAERLAGLSAGRQVVVFTHNVWFAAALAKRSPEAALWRVRSEAGQTGLLSAATAGSFTA